MGTLQQSTRESDSRERARWQRIGACQPMVVREVSHMFDGISGHPRGGDELEAAVAEARTKEKIPPSENTTPSGHQDSGAQRSKRTSCPSPRIWDARPQRYLGRWRQARIEPRMKVRQTMQVQKQRGMGMLGGSGYRVSRTSKPKPSQVWLYQSKCALQVTSLPQAPSFSLDNLASQLGRRLQDSPLCGSLFHSCSVPRGPTKNLLFANC